MSECCVGAGDGVWVVAGIVGVGADCPGAAISLLPQQTGRGSHWLATASCSFLPISSLCYAIHSKQLLLAIHTRDNPDWRVIVFAIYLFGIVIQIHIELSSVSFVVFNSTSTYARRILL